MRIQKDKVVSIHYTLKDKEGNILDTSSGREPLTYLHGNGNLISGMEEGLEGKSSGEKLDLEISPEKGYGVRNEELVQQVSRTAFGDQKVEKGMEFQTKSGHTVVVTKVGLEQVTVDANHPLAGKDLFFNVEVLDIREATKEELDHGHVHGPGGHHH
ncbi:MAG TPA: peptidylprolyl isomerase [Cyclobacteriaceae bacterium]|nr:peptidylprolyl isomerase [Cyclobacteriaceae bacterium]